MAYDHVVCSIPPDGAFLHHRPQRLRCKHPLRRRPFHSDILQFANVHDVSWGTKGDNKVSTDLGAATVGGKNKNEVEVVIPTEQKDINAAYEDALHVIAEKPPKVEQKRDASTKQEDYYKNFRTNVLLAWTLSNGLLGAIVV
jgi:chitin synthase